MELKNKLKNMAIQLGFKKDESEREVYQKIYKCHRDYKIILNFDISKIDYDISRMHIGDNTTSNMYNPENLVVLECIDRLLTKGYSPENIYIEKKWSLGRSNKSGKADVLVTDKEGKSLFIIECKTWGEEFNKEFKRMQSNGGQLFSYLQQERGTRYICLYTSRINNSKNEYISRIINIKDREVDLEDQKNGKPNVKTYKFSETKEELFEVWKEKFNLYMHYNGIFEDDIEAYNVKLKPLKMKDLRVFTQEDSGFVYNQIMEILRHNNISDKSNAFTKINGLILSKIVDENMKNDNEVMDFQYKEGVDSYENFQERILQLYMRGMEEYLNEQIIECSDSKIDELLRNFPDQTAKGKIKGIINNLKFYKNNEFAFTEIHNRELFEKNAKVLIEIVKLLQNYKFSDAHKEQFLGNFFELLLHSGYKQSAGQFFTTTVTARFILASIPMKEIIESKIKERKSDILPYVIDYACGSGHFLTEAIDEIQFTLDNIDIDSCDKKTKNKMLIHRTVSDWTKTYIFGIEKDYRLARTSQVACLLNGSSGVNIIPGDGLENHLSMPESFDILVANPPYSIYSFKQYLNVDNDDYELFKYLSNDAKEIEVLFIERAKQLLRTGGCAGIILPSSILSNLGIYARAREIILKYFEVIGITELGSSAFMATGTSTVVLFLKKRDEDYSIDCKQIADDLIIQNKERENDFIDSQSILKEYVKCLEIEYSDYKSLLCRNINMELSKTEFIISYRKWFNSLKDTINYVASKAYEKLNSDEKLKEMDDRFYDAVLLNEKEKFYYFMLAYGQKTILVNSGLGTKEEKEFIGYEFSSRRGNEGMTVYKDNLYSKPITKLYDAPVADADINEETPEECYAYDHSRDDKVNSYIYRNFLGEKIDSINEELASNIEIVDLVDCFNFNLIDFNKQISMTPTKKIKVNSKFPQCKLGDLAVALRRGTSPKYGDSTIQVIKSGQIRGYEEFDFKQKQYLKSTSNVNERLLQVGDILINSTGVGTAGRVNLFELDGEYVVDNHVTILRLNKEKVLPKYVLYILGKIGFKTLESLALGQSGQIELSIATIENIKIPLPPIEVQKNILDEVEILEKSQKQDIDIVDELKVSINNKFNTFTSERMLRKIGDICTIKSGGTPNTKTMEYWNNATIPWLKSEVCKNDIVSKSSTYISEAGYENSNTKMLKTDTTLVALVGATKGKVGYLTFEACTNQNIAGLYPVDLGQILPKYLYYSCKALYSEFVALGKYKMATIGFIKELSIEVPEIGIQNKIVEEVKILEEELKNAEFRLKSINENINNLIDKYIV